MSDERTRWLEASTSSLSAIASTLALDQPVRTGHELPPDLPGAFITLHGPHQACMVGLVSGRQHAAVLAERFLGEPCGDDLVRDALCEMANLLGGGARDILCEAGHELGLELGLPLYVGGSISGPAVSARSAVRFEYADVVLWVVALVLEQSSEARERRRLEGALSERERRLEQVNEALTREAEELRQAKDRITHLANFDHLTGLANRRFMEGLLPRLILGAERGAGKLAILSIDLDRFKQINDTVGHKGGDHALRITAERLVEALRGTDYVSRLEPKSPGGAQPEVARLGGDEFLVVVPDMRRPEDAAIVAQRLVDRLSIPFQIDGHEFFVTASIGIAVYPDNGTDLEKLVENSDAAMYHAKEQGRNGYQFYTTALSVRAQRRMRIERELRKAIEHGQIVCHYQPRVDLASNRVRGAEALARWWIGTEYISPDEFIPIAEDTGLVKAIGKQVLRIACADARRAADDGLDLTVSVNVAPDQLDAQFADTVTEILEETGTPPCRLEIEITERTLLQRSEGVRDVLIALQARGIIVTIDDFGTGYSSLSYLAGFPIDVVKIDKSFVSQVVGNESSATVTDAIIALSHSLDATVVAEGIESAEQLDFLREHGCDEVQGYFFSKPLPFEELLRWSTDFNASGYPAAAARPWPSRAGGGRLRA